MNFQHDFHYAAYSYLEEWLAYDCHFYEDLAFERTNEPPLEEGAGQLAKLATYYGVSRTLKDNGEKPRLRSAYEFLQTTEPPTQSTRVDHVLSFAHALKASYGSFALSAASKFLWIRFRSPIIIYDSLASNWLQGCECSDYKNDRDYGRYCEVWINQFAQCEDHIKEACSQLRQVKKFTRARGMPDSELSTLTSSEWFVARVFDHFLITQRSLSEPTSPLIPPPQFAH